MLYGVEYIDLVPLPGAWGFGRVEPLMMEGRDQSGSLIIISVLGSCDQYGSLIIISVLGSCDQYGALIHYVLCLAVATNPAL